MPPTPDHPRDPLHGVTLETIVKTLVERHGWEAMGDRIPIRCFILNPSVKSSLTFLRKTPWARTKVERWYVEEGRIIRPTRAPALERGRDHHHGHFVDRDAALLGVRAVLQWGDVSHGAIAAVRFGAGTDRAGAAPEAQEGRGFPAATLSGILRVALRDLRGAAGTVSTI